MDETRALLDALMGPSRNTKADERKSGQPEFADRTVCKEHLVGFCCRDWFSLPKRQLDPCTKIHSDFLKSQFESHPEMKKYRAWWEEDFLAHLERVALDCDQFIVRERAKCRPKGQGPRLPGDVKDKIEDMQKRYDAFIKQAEELADKDEMTQSRDQMTQAVVLKEQIDEIRTRHNVEFAGEDICEVCGVKYPLGAGGAEWHDKESHMKGKTHQGYAEIRAKITELKGKRKHWEKYADEKKDQRRNQEKEEEEKRKEEKRKAREREKEKEREKRKEEEKRKEREKEREKERAKQKAEEEAKRKKREAEKESRDKDRERSRGRRRSRSSARSSSRGAERKSKGGKKDRSRSRSRSRGKGRSRSDAKAKASAASDDGKQKAGSDDESDDGVSVTEEDIPDLWEKLQSLDPEARAENLAALTASTTARLEAHLVSKVKVKKKKTK